MLSNTIVMNNLNQNFVKYNNKNLVNKTIGMPPGMLACQVFP